MTFLLDEKHFDVVVVGTGLEQAVVSAACARAGKSVLHVDPCTHYGGVDGTLSIDEFETISNQGWPSSPNTSTNRQESSDCETEDDGDMLLAEFAAARFDDIVKQECPLPELKLHDTFNGSDMALHAAATQSSESCVPAEVLDDFKTQSRRFCIDLNPIVAASSGEMVDCLIHSGVGKYMEFKLIEHVYLSTEENLHAVPAHKGEVFRSKAIPPLQKRALMKFLKEYGPSFSFDAGADAGAAVPEKGSSNKQARTGQSFASLLDENGLSPLLQQFIARTLSFTDLPLEECSAEDGLAAMRTYLESMGRYGKAAFLTPLYGAGEAAQAFCRLSAVFGGVFALGYTVTNLVTRSNGALVGVKLSNGQIISCDHVVTSPHCLPLAIKERLCAKDGPSAQSSTSVREVVVTHGSVFPQQPAAGSICPSPGSEAEGEKHSIPCWTLGVGNETEVCPKDFSITYILGRSTEEQVAESAVQGASRQLLSSTSKDDSVVWRGRVTQRIFHSSIFDEVQEQFKGLHVVGIGRHEWDCRAPFRKAKEVFNAMFSDAGKDGETHVALEFLPPLPDPDAEEERRELERELNELDPSNE